MVSLPKQTYSSSTSLKEIEKVVGDHQLPHHYI